MQESVSINGIEYISDSSLTSGEYGGAGSVGVANIRTIEAHAEDNGLEVEHCSYSDWGKWAAGSVVAAWRGSGRLPVDPPTAPIVKLEGAYYSQSIFVRADNEELREMVDSLESYPLLDDEAHSLV